MKNIGKTQPTEILLLIVLAVLWGSSFTFIKIAVETVPPATIVAGRLVLGAALLLLIAKIKGLVFPTDIKVWGALFVQGLLQSALPFTLISWGEQFIDSGLAGLLNATPPIFAFIITVFILRQSEASLRKFIGVCIGFIGVLVTLGPDILSNSSDSIWGQAAIVGASICYAFAAIYARRFSNQPAIMTAACSMTMAALIMVPISLVIDEPWAVDASLDAFVSIAVLGVFSTAIAMILYFRLVKTLGAVGVTSGGYLRAGFSVLFGVMFLGELLTTSLLLGLGLILLSVAIVTGQIRLPANINIRFLNREKRH